MLLFFIKILDGEQNITEIQSIPLRQRKKARNKLALLDAAIEKMRKKPLADITVEELCQESEISKGTFFRYFARKVDLIFFFIRLWSVQAVWIARNDYKASAGLSLIEAIFIWTGKIFEGHPRLFAECVALRAFEPEGLTKLSQNKRIMVGSAERLLRFPEMEGIETIPEGTFLNILRENLEMALDKGELPNGIDLETVILSLMSIFYGIPLMLGDRIHKNIPEAYSRQLKLLWAGLKSTEGKESID